MTASPVLGHHLWAEAVKAPGDSKVYLLRRTYSNARGRWETRKWWVTTSSGADDGPFFRDLGYADGYIKDVPSATLDAYAAGPKVLSPGTLYRAPFFANSDVYYIGDDRKSHYVSAAAFTERGFDDGDIYFCSTAG